MCMWLLMEIKLQNLQPFEGIELSHFRELSCAIGGGVCLIHSSRSFQWILFELSTHIVGIMKVCIQL